MTYQGELVRHTFAEAGRYEAQCTVKLKGAVVFSPALWPIPVTRSESDMALAAAKRIRKAVAFIAFLIACLSGAVLIDVFAKTFGDLKDYLVAFLWGAGVDKLVSTAQGLPALANRITQLLPKSKKTT